jgi:hypothetical protein
MSPEAVVVADFDGDTILDVATPNFFDDTVTILLGKGDGTLAMLAVCSNQSGRACHVTGDCQSGGTCSPEPIAVGFEPYALAAADLNKDGNIDLIVANSSGGPTETGSLMVLQGMGGGVFVAQPEINSDRFNDPVAITAAFGPLDLNGDSYPDLVVANDAGDSLSVLFGKGDLTFQSAIQLNLSVGSTPEGVAVADFNGDGHPDIASSASFEDKVSVFVGLDSGTFAAPQDVALAAASMPSPLGIAVGDFDKDGKIDFATANTLQDGTGGASVFLNATGVTLAASISSSDAVIPLTDASAFPASGTTILIDQEQIAYTGKQGNTLTGASRGANGTVAAPHAQGAAVVPAGCVGDCSGDLVVTVDEILTMVDVALGSVPVSACVPGDANRDQLIAVDEILTAVNNALNGCQP